MKNFAQGLLIGSFLITVVTACAQMTYGNPEDPVAGVVLGTAIHTRDAEELRYVILRQLTDRYADEKGITVTQAEKAAYIKHVQDALSADRERKTAQRDALARKLAQEGLTEAERKALTSELETLNRSLAALGDISFAKVDPEDAQAREQVAAAFIRQWKINRALYQQYGGRVIFQQGGPEPLDAYRKFLQEHRARGDFKILNKDLETAFWRYYVTDSIHSFYPPGSKEETEVFDVPWWQSR